VVGNELPTAYLLEKRIRIIVIFRQHLWDSGLRCCDVSAACAGTAIGSEVVHHQQDRVESQMKLWIKSLFAVLLLIAGASAASAQTYRDYYGYGPSAGLLRDALTTAVRNMVMVAVRSTAMGPATATPARRQTGIGER
jgi:hypothetical protein